MKVVAAVVAGGCLACAGAVALTLWGSDAGSPALDAELRAAVIAVPIVVGLSVWYSEAWHRFGRLLVAWGFAFAITTLAQSGNSFLYSSGRVAWWLVELLLIFLVLAFPTGTLTTRPARRLVAAGVLVVALLYLPTALLVDSYPTPAPPTSCDDCPGNAFMLLGSQPAFIDDLLVPVRELATMIVLAGVLAVLGTRIRSGSRLMRITLVPVFAFAAVHVLALIGALVSRRISADATATDVFMTAVTLSYGGVALGFLAGFSGWRLFENRGLRRLSASLASHPPALTLSETSELLSDAMDPSLELFHKPGGGSWLDVEGHRVDSLPADGKRSATTVMADDGHEVAVVHDVALRDSRAFQAVTRSSVLKALESERLGVELRRSLRELSESRARIMASADRERQQIEQNLHDGAQQSLVALRIRLDLASQLLAESPGRAEELLGELAAEVDAALEEVRSLARGVYPSLLASRGLGEALESAALRCPVLTTVDVDGIGRYLPQQEAATYFCCLEAMQNAMKHADGVTRISVELSAASDLRFEVRDDGAGFVQSDLRPGSGLTSMRDRLAAVGGVLRVTSAPGRGTRVAGSIPLSTNGSRQNGQAWMIDLHERS
jgi:signal transduction histidine kinase